MADAGTACYKVVTRIMVNTPAGDGRVISASVRHGDGGYDPLSYYTEEITFAPPHTPGIFVFNNPADAQRFWELIKDVGGEEREIWEAEGYDLLPKPWGIDANVTYPKGWLDSSREVHGEPTPEPIAPAAGLSPYAMVPGGTVLYKGVRLVRRMETG